MKSFNIPTITLLLALMLPALCARAADVDAVMAGARATAFLKARTAGRLASASPVVRLAHVEPSSRFAGKADFYVFNGNEGEAFVIVSGEDRAEAVLGYGEGSLDMNNLPCNLQAWLMHYKEQIDWLRDHPEARVEIPKRAQGVVIEPLLVCTWSQGEPYYNQCPVYKNKRCVTGCIATAMAQVLYYWKYPDSLPDLPSYTSNTYGITVPSLPSTDLHWDGMLDGYHRLYTAEQGDAVAVLMRYCGQASSMDYGTNGSGSFIWNQMVGMQMFGYSMGARVMHRDEHSADDWNAMMLEDLSNHYPILYTGQGEDGGHAFVIDGYDGHDYHINWGWEGAGNGYFALDAFIVGENDFTWNQQMVHGLMSYSYKGTYDVEIDGVCYKFTGDEAAVACRTETFASYKGHVVIPERITCDGVTREVTAIANNAFRSSTQLTGVSLPSTLKRIGKYAFKDCTGLKQLTVPDGVSLIDYAAFEGCHALTSLSLGHGLEEIGYYVFADCIGLNHLQLPETLHVIGVGAFSHCTGLRRVNTGNGVTTIGADAFLGCRALSNVTLGLSTDSIAPGAFHGCSSLANLTVMSELPPIIDVETFDATHYATVKLIVPQFALDNYICDLIWTLFQNKASLEEEVNPGDVNLDGEVNIVDVNEVIDAILTTGDTGIDVNGDGELNIVDVNAVIDIILGGA